MDNNNTVAVVMCTYNGEKYLRPQLDSIMAQTHRVSELIVQDDCSTDSTMDILHEYAGRYPFMRVYRNEHNLGFNLNFKSAVMRATADFVAISDQDDVWMPHKIETLLRAIGPYNICCSDHLRGVDMSTAHRVSPRWSLEALLFGGFAGHTMLLRRSFIQREEVWLPGIYYDWSLALNAYFYGERAIVHVNEPLNWHRSHDAEAAFLQSLSVYPHSSQRPTWQPYVFGPFHFRRLQRKPAWQTVYNHILKNTSGRYPLPHAIAREMLSRGPLPLLRLCRLCLVHRREIYPEVRKTEGLMGRVRSFCYPFIFAYRCSQFDL